MKNSQVKSMLHIEKGRHGAFFNVLIEREGRIKQHQDSGLSNFEKLHSCQK